MAEAQVKVNYIADTSSLDASFNRISQRAQQTSQQIAKSGGAMSSSMSKFSSGFQGAANLVGGSASQITSQIGGVSSAFGGMAEAGAGIAGPIGMGAAAVVAIIAGIGKAAYGVGKEFDDAYDSIIVKTGATGDKLEQLKGSFRNVFATVPVDAATAAEAIGQLQARLQGTNFEGGVGELAHDVARLAQLTHGDAAQAVDEFANILFRFNVPADQARDLLNKMFAASQASGVGFAQLAGEVSGAAASLTQFGVPAQEAVALMAAIDKTGGDTGKVTTGFNRALVKLSENANGLSGQLDGVGGSSKSAAASLKAAERAARDAAQGVEKAQHGLAESQWNLVKVMSITIPREQERGRRDLRNATEGVSDANDRLIDAQKRLAEAMKGSDDENKIAEARNSLSEATDAVAIAETRLAAAQRALQKQNPNRNAEAYAAALADVQDAQAAVRSAQDNAFSSQNNLNDAMSEGDKQAQKIADAQKDVSDAQRAVRDAIEARIQLEEDLNDRLGQNLDGSVLLAEAQGKVADAEDRVKDALQRQRDAADRGATAAGNLASKLGEVKGIGPATKKVLDDLGLGTADVQTQFEGLVEWLAKNPKDPMAIQVAAELFGSKAAPEMIAALGNVGTAIDDVKKKMDGGAGSIEKTGKNTDDAAERMKVAWNRFKIAFEPIATRVFDLGTHIADGFVAVASTAGFVVGLAESYFNGLVTFFIELPSKLANAGKDVFSFLTNSFRFALNWIIEQWNKFGFQFPTVDIPFLGKVGGWKFDTPDIPKIPAFAKGGIVTRPTLGLVGEAGPEAIVPLNRHGGMGTTYIKVEVNAPPLTNPAEVGRQVKDALKAYERRNGTGWRDAA